MPRVYVHGAVDVADEPTEICVVPQDISSVKLKNAGDATVYIGGPQVRSEGDGIGFPVEPGEKQDFPTFDSDIITVYGIVPEGEGTTVIFLVSSGGAL